MDRFTELRRGVNQSLERVRVGVSDFLNSERRTERWRDSGKTVLSRLIIVAACAVLGYEITSLLIRPNQIHLREILLKEKAYLLAQPLEWQ